MKKTIVLFAALFFVALNAASASALTINLTHEFDGFLTPQTYATIDITENSGDLDFVISLDMSLLGVDADIHQMYFNLDFTPITAPTITTDNSPNTAYTVFGPDPSVTGGAGASFNWGVDFGNGGGGKGNGILQYATFTLSTAEALALSNILVYSTTNNTPPVVLAIHFQGTDTPPGSETIGGDITTVPVPGAVWLLGSGLVGLVGFRRKRRR